MSKREACAVIMLGSGAVGLIFGMFLTEITLTISGAAIVVFAGCYEIANAIKEG